MQTTQMTLMDNGLGLVFWWTRIGRAWGLRALILLATVATGKALDFAYRVNSPETNTITITSYLGTGGAVTIPSTIDGLLVVYIGGSAFSGRYSVTSVTIPDGVTYIGSYAFQYCTNLTSVTIPNGVASIENETFYACNNLTNITIPDSVTYIGNKAFLGCESLTSVTIGNSVAGIGWESFAYCGMTSVTIPDSVIGIGSYAFCWCTNLTSVAIGQNVTSIGEHAFRACTALTNVLIGNSVTSIGDSAFSGSSLTYITIPNSVTSIGDSAFAWSSSLKGVYFLGNAPALDSNVFQGDYSATVYYMWGTTGWGSVFGGRPSVLWDPHVQSDGSFGVRTNQLGFTITGSTNLVIVVEACTNLVSRAWSSVGTNTLTGGSSSFGDPRWTNYPIRFYRFRAP